VLGVGHGVRQEQEFGAAEWGWCPSQCWECELGSCNLRDCAADDDDGKGLVEMTRMHGKGILLLLLSLMYVPCLIGLDCLFRVLLYTVNIQNFIMFVL
jgi:hypothetical protein